MPEASYLSHHFLIAMPALHDPNFSRGVAYVCQHNEQGAMGILVNHPSDYSLGDVLGQMGIATGDAMVAAAPVLIGGPVQPERGFVLHDNEGQWDSSFVINERLCLTTSRDILAAVAEGRGPRRRLVALGYAGWSAGQLEHEMRENSWLAVAADEHVLFEVPMERRWEEAAKLVGVRIGEMTDLSGHA
jgi:putative transcriptional regulator